MIKKIEDLKANIYEKYGDRLEIYGNYHGMNKKINFIYNCPRHGYISSESLPSVIMSKKGVQPCKKCALEKKIITGNKNVTELMENMDDCAKEKGGILLSKKWINASAKYKFKCNIIEHPEFESTYKNIVNSKSWCPYCSGIKNLNFNDELKDIINKKGGELIRGYKSSTEKVVVKCKKHNYSWEILPSNIKSNKWCYICNMPKSEKIFYDLLVQSDINVFPQYKIENLNIEIGSKLRFDFAIILKNSKLVLLEIDDNEHRHNHSKESKRGVKRNNAKKMDEYKNLYCLNNNIQLIRINVHRHANYYNDEKMFCEYAKKEIINAFSFLGDEYMELKNKIKGNEEDK